MADKIIDFIDAILTIIFWIPAKLIGYEKCAKCTVRVRFYQFMMIITKPISFIPSIKSARIDWEIRANLPPKGGLTAVNLQEI